MTWSLCWYCLNIIFMSVFINRNCVLDEWKKIKWNCLLSLFWHKHNLTHTKNVLWHQTVYTLANTWFTRSIRMPRLYKDLRKRVSCILQTGMCAIAVTKGIGCRRLTLHHFHRIIKQNCPQYLQKFNLDLKPHHPLLLIKAGMLVHRQYIRGFILQNCYLAVHIETHLLLNVI